MANIKISELPEKTDAPSNDDLLVIEDQEDTKKITLQKLKGILSMDNILTSIKEFLETKITEFLEVHSNRMKELEKKNYDLETLCHNLENDHDHDMERISELQNRLHEFERREEELSSIKDILSEKVENLELEIPILENQIEESLNNLIEKEKSIIVLQSKVKDLQIKVSELKNMNSILENNMEQMREDFNNVNNQQFESANDKIDESIRDLKTMIRFYHPDVIFE